MEDIEYWIWLSILDLKPIEKIKLVEFFKTPKSIFELNEKELKNLTDSENLIKKIIDKNKRNSIEKIIKYAEKNNIKLICSNSKVYSQKLKKIYDYPVLLYAKGNTKLLNKKAISIVGCRNCSEYGRIIAQKFSYMLARKDICIVSGMARGIDTYAHKGAITAQGSTIAVLGSGINYIYPYENTKLYVDILNNNGLIISEYGIHTRPKPEYFPIRNRIISGLSDKTLVVEASKKSGSIITANLAVEQGREVYAIPGNIISDRSMRNK